MFGARTPRTRATSVALVTLVSIATSVFPAGATASVLPGTATLNRPPATSVIDPSTVAVSKRQAVVASKL